jgi:hypothetical protein
MADTIIHDLDYGDLEFYARLCVRTRDSEGLSQRYWLAKRWRDNAVECLEHQRFQNTCGVVAATGKKLENYDEKPLKPVLALKTP